MTLYTEGTRIRQTRYLEEFESTLADVLSATAEESLLFSPTSSLSRIRERQTEELGAIIPGPRSFGEPTRLPPATPMLDAESARKRIAEEKLDLTVPDEGIREGALNLLMERKRAERKRQDILNRAPGGFGTGSLRLTTALATSLLDPLNVASAFIPAVGPTRYAGLLAKAGSGLARTGVRARVGALEGAVGAALVEPIILTAAMREQADYDLADSLLNVAFGTVLGGGLHIGAGALGDLANPRQWRTAGPTGAMPELLARVAPETREAALRAAVAQAVEGRVVDVDALLNLDGRMSRTRLLQTTTAAGRGVELPALRPDAAAQAGVQRNTVPILNREGQAAIFPDERQARNQVARQAEKGIKAVVEPDPSGRGFAVRREIEGDLRRSPDGTPVSFKTERAAARFIRQMGIKADPVPFGPKGDVKWGVLEGGMPVDAAAFRAAPWEAFVAPRENTRAVQADPRAPSILRQSALDAVRETVSKQARPESVRLADTGAAADAETKFQEVPKSDDIEAVEAELTDAMQGAQDTAKALGLEETSTRPPVLRESDPAFQSLDAFRQGIERDYRLATTLNVVDDIEAAAARSMTAKETVKELGNRLDRIEELAAANNEPLLAQRDKEGLVRAVRSKLGIPSLDERTEFNAWLDLYKQRKTGDVVTRELAPFDELIATADAYGAAVRAAALCQLRRG